MAGTLHRAFGLCWQANRPLPGLPILPGTPRVDVRVSLNDRPAWLVDLLRAPQAPWYVSPFRDGDGRPVVTGWRLADGRHRRLASAAGELIVDEVGTRLWIDGDAPGIFDDCFGWMMGLALRLRGVLCLHASAVVVDGAAFAFVGPEGSGKSTLAAALAGRGYPVVADDLVAVAPDDLAGVAPDDLAGVAPDDLAGDAPDDLAGDAPDDLAAAAPYGAGFLVQPGLPWVRLRPSAGPWIADNGALRLVETADGRYADLRADRSPAAFWHHPAPLGGLWFLAPPRVGPPIIRPRTARDACLALLGRTWATRLLAVDQRAAELDQLARLTAGVDAREVAAAAAPADLDALCAALVATARAARIDTARARAPAAPRTA